MTTNTPIKNILFPTDFSTLSDNALATAIAMCKRHSASLHILHVVENGYAVVPRGAHNSAAYLLPEFEKSGQDNLDNLASAIKNEHALEARTYLDLGNPAESISNKAADLNCELIVMGTHGASGIREFFIGSTAYSVIKNTGIPVLTIPWRKKVKDFNCILFPIRSSKGIIEKYDFIEPIIKANNAKLVIAGLSLPGEEYKLGPLDKEITTLGNALRLGHTCFKSENYVCENYAKKVLALAKKEKVDLIVINASLDHNWRQFFIGPYVQQVVNHSKVPVLSLRTIDNTPPLTDGEKEGKSTITSLKLAY